MPMSLTALVVAAALAAPALAAQADPHAGHHPDQIAAAHIVKPVDQVGCPMMKGAMTHPAEMDRGAMMSGRPDMMSGGNMQAMKARCMHHGRQAHGKMPHRH